MPVPVVKTDTGRYLVLEPAADPAGRTVLYCRVSSAEQEADLERQVGRVVTAEADLERQVGRVVTAEADLERQVGRVVTAATGRGLTVAQVVTEVGSGLDGDRPKLAKLLRDPQVTTIVVEHRDRLARFGVEDLSCALAATGRSIVVIDDVKVADDLVRDMVEVLTWFCVRLYGRRSAPRKAKAAMAAVEATG
jgi:putative resolvase